MATSYIRTQEAIKVYARVDGELRCYAVDADCFDIAIKVVKNSDDGCKAALAVVK